MGISLLCTSMNQGAQSPWLAVDRRCGSPCHKHRKPASSNPLLVACTSLKKIHFYHKVCANTNINIVLWHQLYIKMQEAFKHTCRSGKLCTRDTASLTAEVVQHWFLDRHHDSAAHSPYSIANPTGPQQSHTLHTVPPLRLQNKHRVCHLKNGKRYLLMISHLFRCNSLPISSALSMCSGQRSASCFMDWNDPLAAEQGKW